MISESLSTLWTRWNLTYSVNFAFSISPNILEPLGSSSYRSHLFIYLFIYFSAFMTFDSVPESHTYKYSTFQAQNPGRFLSCMRKEMALLTFSLPAGIIVRGYEDRVVILCLLSNFLLSSSQSEQRHIFRTLSCRDGDQSCVKRESGFQSLKSRNTNVGLFGSTQGHWLAEKYRVTFSANQNTNPKSMLGCCARFTRLALYSPL